MDLEALSRLRRLCRSGEARRIRSESGVSLSEMASAIGGGTQPSTVQRWETGQRAPRGETALRYLEQLDLLARVAAA